MAQQPYYSPAGGTVPQPAYIAPSPPPEHPADSVGSWMLALLLTALPVIGFIYVLVLAFGGSASASRCNWARAVLIWQIIALVGVIAFFVLGGWALLESQR